MSARSDLTALRQDAAAALRRLAVAALASGLVAEAEIYSAAATHIERMARAIADGDVLGVAEAGLHLGGEMGRLTGVVPQ